MSMLGSVRGIVALVTGGGSGLGHATVHRLLAQGAKGVVSFDIKHTPGSIPSDLSKDKLITQNGSVNNDDEVNRALDEALSRFGRLDVVVNCAGVGVAQRIYNPRKVIPHSMEDFKRLIEVNALGTFNVNRLSCRALALNDPNTAGDEPRTGVGLRGILINTASVAAFEGQVGQVAYAASKGAVVSMTLPIARDLSGLGIRCMTVAPGLFDTPLLHTLPEKVRLALADRVPCPRRLGLTDEYAHLVQAIIENPMLNGEVIRLDGALRMEP